MAEFKPSWEEKNESRYGAWICRPVVLTVRCGCGADVPFTDQCGRLKVCECNAWVFRSEEDERTCREDAERKAAVR